jgi:hypothetical protein
MESSSFGGLRLTVILNTLGQIVPLLFVVVVGILALEFALYRFFTRVVKTRHALPFTLLSLPLSRWYSS